MYRKLLISITITVCVVLGAVAVFAFTGAPQAPFGGSPYFWQMSDSDTYYSSGNIGIGTTTTAYGVHVQDGDIYASGYARGGAQVCIGADCRSSWGDAPSGSVSFFNLSSCPTGWSEYTAARGRYIVGLPSGGTLAGTVGTALSNLQNRAVGQHTHTVTDPGHFHYTDVSRQSTIGGTLGNDMDFAFLDDLTDTAYTGISIDNAGDVAGTNAPYIQLLICEKD